MNTFSTIIKPKPKWQLLDFSEIWKYRELFAIFAWRDLKVRYKQTMIGASWALFQPLFSMFVFTIFFGQIARIPSGELPYSLFVLVGLIFWTYFSGILTNASGSMIENEHIIKKVYFPRMILPASKVLVSLIDFLIAFVMLVAVMIFFGKIPHINFLWLVPLGLLIASIGAVGMGLFLAAVNVKYRDIRYALPFFIQMMVFFTPVIYPTNIMRPAFAKFMAINPMTAVVESVRTAITGSGVVNWEIMLISSVSSVAFLIVGLIYFRSTERFFADVI
jgi:lipopolysaccharide transport system permease protein